MIVTKIFKRRFKQVGEERNTDSIDAFKVASFSQAMHVIFVPAFSLSFKLP
jgi:hypothetical protein